MKKRYNITVVGAGYVGLSLAIMLSLNNDVTAADINRDCVDKINMKISPIKDELIETYLRKKDLSLHASTDIEGSCAGADYIILALPTDYSETQGGFDCSTIDATAAVISRINSDATVVIKSTVSIGYTESLRKKYPDQKIINVPEFLRESKALYDNLNPSRIIIGTDEKAYDAATVFAELLKNGAEKEDIRVLMINSTEAEAVKLFSNTYLAMRVGFFNELDTFADRTGLDSKSIIDGVCLDPRIGEHYNNPSFGYGGYCLPKDTKQLLSDYSGIPQSIISGIVRSNEIRKRYIAERIMEIAQKKTSKPVIGIYRLIMKSNSDNFRESAVLDVMEELTKKGAEILVYEPMLKSGLNDIGFERTDDLRAFKHRCTLIVANRYSEKDLRDVRDKVYTRDLYNRD